MAPGTDAARKWLLAVVPLVVAALVLGVWLAVRGGDMAASAGAAQGTPSARPAPAGSTATPSIADPSSAPSALTTVPVGRVRTKAPVPMDEKGDFGGGVGVRLVGIEAVHGVAHGPGQIAGPALRLTLRISNDSAAPVPLTGLVVNVSYGPQHLPASILSGPGAAPFGASVKPGESESGTYVFAVPADGRGQVSVEVSYSAQEPTVVFRGSAG
ncbi:MAG TPA: hypothetical protein VLW53_14590 [Candidatus Eisenbacteria bacterium]|nr:hypothetical protein [Candidatus Eisenbacteria bacterium]